MFSSPRHRRAALVMAAMIIAGCLLGGFNSGRRLKNDLEDIFYQGEYKNGVGVASDISHRVDCGRSLATVAARYMEPDDKAVAFLREMCADAEAATTLTEKKAADDSVETAFVQLYELLEKEALSAKDEAYRKSIYADFTSYGDTMSHDPYNDAAVRYNREINAFPGSVFFKLMGLEKAPYFR